MEIDVQIERISNGYIVKGNDSSQSKRYYRSLGEFMEALVIEELNDKDRAIREHDTMGQTWEFKLVTDL